MHHTRLFQRMLLPFFLLSTSLHALVPPKEMPPENKATPPAADLQILAVTVLPDGTWHLFVKNPEATPNKKCLFGLVAMQADGKSTLIQSWDLNKDTKFTAFSPTGDTVLVQTPAAADKTLSLEFLRKDHKEPQFFMGGFAKDAYKFAFSPDGKQVARIIVEPGQTSVNLCPVGFGATECQSISWLFSKSEISAKGSEQSATGMTEILVDLTYVDKNTLAVVTHTGKVGLFDVGTGEKKTLLIPKSATPNTHSMASQAGKWIVTFDSQVEGQTSFVVWNVATKQEMAHHAVPLAVAQTTYSSKNGQLAVYGQNSKIYIWNSKDWKTPPVVFFADLPLANCIFFDASGRLVWASSGMVQTFKSVSKKWIPDATYQLADVLVRPSKVVDPTFLNDLLP